MKRESTNAGKLGQLMRLNAALIANAADLAYLEGTRVRFEALVNEAHAVAREQAALVAGKQQASQRLATLLNEALRMATGLQRLLTEHYGLRSEKLAEFGLQPFRGRQPKEETEEPEAPAPAPPLAKSAAPEDAEA